MDGVRAQTVPVGRPRLRLDSTAAALYSFAQGGGKSLSGMCIVYKRTTTQMRARRCCTTGRPGRQKFRYVATLLSAPHKQSNKAYYIEARGESHQQRKPYHHRPSECCGQRLTSAEHTALTGLMASQINKLLPLFMGTGLVGAIGYSAVYLPFYSENGKERAKAARRARGEDENVKSDQSW